MNHHIRSAIMKIIVHKIEIKPNGFEIFFNVGENHYKEALGLRPGASFFVSTDYNGHKNKKPSVELSTEGLEFIGTVFNGLYATRNLKFFSSSRLTNGGSGRN